MEICVASFNIIKVSGAEQSWPCPLPNPPEELQMINRYQAKESESFAVLPPVLSGAEQ